MVQVENRELVKSAFRDIFEAKALDEKIVARYFSPDYIQHVDGEVIDYEAFLNHLRAQRKMIENIEITFLTVVSEGDKVFSNHLVTARKKDGGIGKVKVIAEFTVKEGKIAACDELTLMLEGAEEDRNLGSIRD